MRIDSKEWKWTQKFDYYYKERDITQKFPNKQYIRDTSLLICSDICQPTIYGETTKPILRCINFDSLIDNPIKTLKFNKPNFTKCNKNQFNNIQIKLYRNLNHLSFSKKTEYPYWMKYGLIKITLQFRKI